MAWPPSRTDEEIRAALEAAPRNEHGCWERGGGLANGYAKIGYQGGRCLAHRVSWEVFRGPVPDGLCVCHHCDNRCCVNPEHLFLGTRAENLADMWAKGRASTSEQRATFGNRRLTESDVTTIDHLYANGLTQQEIAKRFGVHQTAVSKILRRASWQHVRKS